MNEDDVKLPSEEEKDELNIRLLYAECFELQKALVDTIQEIIKKTPNKQKGKVQNKIKEYIKYVYKKL